MCLSEQRDPVNVHRVAIQFFLQLPGQGKPNGGSGEGLFSPAAIGGWRQGYSVGCNLQKNKPTCKGHFHTSKEYTVWLRILTFLMCDVVCRAKQKTDIDWADRHVIWLKKQRLQEEQKALLKNETMQYTHMCMETHALHTPPDRYIRSK